MADASDKKAAPKSRVLKGRVGEWYIGKGTPRRKWISIEVPYGEIKQLVRIEQYDATTQKGVQRGEVESWQKKLVKEMLAGVFTPTPWAAGVRKSHIKDLTIEKGKDIALTINSGTPLISLDGQQRWGAMERIYKLADVEQRKDIDTTDITVIIYLDPDRLNADFIGINAGKSIDKTHLGSLKLKAGMLSKEDKPVMEYAVKMASILNDDKESPFEKQIKFDSRGTQPLALASITTLGKSDIGTSLSAGAKLGLYKPFNKEAEWMASMYVEAYKAILEYDEKNEVRNELDGTIHKICNLLQYGKFLCPLHKGGKKGGASLMIGIGNVLAYRMIKLGLDKPIPKEGKHLVDCLEDVFDGPIAGNLGGGTKRQLLGTFTRLYLADMVRTSVEDEDDPKKVDSRDGIPMELIELWSPSTLGVDRNATVNGAPADDEGSEEEEGEEEVEQQDEPEELAEFEPATPPAKTKGGKKGKLLEV